jgi:hypothetical protein
MIRGMGTVLGAGLGAAAGAGIGHSIAEGENDTRRTDCRCWGGLIGLVVGGAFGWANGALVVSPLLAAVVMVVEAGSTCS